MGHIHYLLAAFILAFVLLDNVHSDEVRRDDPPIVSTEKETYESMDAPNDNTTTNDLPVTGGLLDANDAIDSSTDVGNSAVSSTASDGGKIRVVTKEELAFHDGKQTKTVWLSIMSKVFDVTAGPEYYSEKAPYNVFVGRDGNVPFVTGVFNPEEADKPLSELEPHQLSNLEHWMQFYVDEERYPFVGLLEGELYDKDGNPTEMYTVIQEKIAIVKAKVAERKKQTAERIAQRQRDDEERKKQAAKKSSSSKKRSQNNFFSSILKYIRGEPGVNNEL